MILEDGGVPLPDFTNPGAILGWMLVVAFLTVVGWGNGRFSNVGRRSGGEPVEAKSVERQEIEKRYGVDTDDMSDTLAKVIARQERRLSALETDNADLHVDLRVARWDLRKIWAWIEAGCPNPPGPGARPAYLDDLETEDPPHFPT